MNLSTVQYIICKKGNLEDIISLVNQGYNKTIILHELCYYDHLEAIRYLVEKCKVDVRANHDYAVRLASADGHLEVVKYLVEKCGADARANHDYAVRLTSVGGHLEVIKYLVEKFGADVTAEDNYAVRLTSAYRKFKVVKYLVEKCGADARARNDEAVKWASAGGHLEVVKYLIEQCGAILPTPNPRYDRYISVCETGERRRIYTASKRIYFWWVQACYNPSTLTGQRSMYKGYREYLNIR